MKSCIEYYIPIKERLGEDNHHVPVETPPGSVITSDYIRHSFNMSNNNISLGIC